jgi:hypothetical protein
MGAAMSFSWGRVAREVRKLVAADGSKPIEEQNLDDGQRASLTWIAKRLPVSGVVLADEVGTGKTRIACAVVQAVLQAGGRVAVVVPHGLMHQWVAESLTFGPRFPQPRRLSTLAEFLNEASLVNGHAEDTHPRPDESEWWLISHGFRVPRTRVDTYWWRLALPSLVRCHLAPRNEREDGRTAVGRIGRCVEAMKEQRWKGWVVLDQMAESIAHRISKGGHPLRASLNALPLVRLEAGADNSELAKSLQVGGSAHAVMEALLGLWLGDFNLVVIDEAHKSRGELDAEEPEFSAGSSKVLTRLVDALLKQAEGGRRLCLTATPMELELSQWLDLLARARSGLDRERGRQVIARLHAAAIRAAVAPDEASRLDELCAAAKDFTRTLAPYVTRRRRDDDRLVTRFRESLCDERRRDAPHPHRNVRSLSIGWAETAGQHSPWLDVLFAAECMSQSARGLTLKDTADWPRAVRDAYTKLSAGHVSVDLSETSEQLRIPEPGAVDDHTRGKIARAAYWYRRLRDGRRRILHGLPSVNGAEFDPDAEHPRILAAVREIEGWTLKREKVLVFGVFLRPLRLLRDVLNVRHALRAADVGRPIAHAVHTDATLAGIAIRQIDRLRAEGALSGRLSTGNGVEMRRALADSHKAYKRLRDKVRWRAKKPVVAWRTDPSLLAGAPVDREFEGALEDHLVSFIIDDFLATTSESDEVTDARFDALTSEFVEERMRPLLGELGDEDVDEQQAVLRQKALRALLEDDDGRQSFHARLLQGATRWETRRYLQAAFNRSNASPWVLIAQSQVGREGLNLHESCRVVVQFHAEWNPAVLEQQIGRVDRKGSLWEQRAQTWLADMTTGKPPFIEVRQLIFEGTYDAFQWDRVMRRQHVFDASLFGALLPAEAWDRVPEDRLEDLLAAAPRFRPPRSG